MSLASGLELKEFNAASLTGSYQNLGTAILNPAYSMVLSNESDVGVYISLNGSTNDIRLSAGQILPLTAYSKHNNLLQGSYICKSGVQLQIKQVTGAGTGVIIVNILTTV